MSTKSFRELFAEPRQSDSYWETRAALDFTEAVYRRMTTLGLTKSQLAERLGTSPAYVTKILGGEANFTLKTMVRLARALEAEIVAELVPGAETAANGAKEETVAVADDEAGHAYGRREGRGRGDEQAGQRALAPASPAAAHVVVDAAQIVRWRDRTKRRWREPDLSSKKLRFLAASPQPMLNP